MGETSGVIAKKKKKKAYITPTTTQKQQHAPDKEVNIWCNTLSLKNKAKKKKKKNKKGNEEKKHFYCTGLLHSVYLSAF